MHTTTKRAWPGKGLCKIADNSSLRKLMRAARRGKIPDERLVIIKLAGRNAVFRWNHYINRS